MEFINYNHNPKHKTGDCVVRAIAEGTGKSWEEVYDGLCKIGRRMFRMPSEKEVYDEYLQSLGWKKQKMPRRKDRTRYTVAEFIEENPKLKAIVNVASHVTVIDESKLIDLWNCSRKCMGNYWTKSQT